MLTQITKPVLACEIAGGLRDEDLPAVSRSRDCIGGAPEGNEECIALRVDLYPPVTLESRAQNPAVLGERVRIAISQLFQQLRRALDVREEERDGAGREFVPHKLNDAPPANPGQASSEGRSDAVLGTRNARPPRRGSRACRGGGRATARAFRQLRGRRLGDGRGGDARGRRGEGRLPSSAVL